MHSTVLYLFPDDENEKKHNDSSRNPQCHLTRALRHQHSPNKFTPLVIGIAIPAVATSSEIRLKLPHGRRVTLQRPSEIFNTKSQ
jgi:hypothetical protein